MGSSISVFFIFFCIFLYSLYFLSIILYYLYFSTSLFYIFHFFGFIFHFSLYSLPIMLYSLKYQPRLFICVSKLNKYGDLLLNVTFTQMSYLQILFYKFSKQSIYICIISLVLFCISNFSQFKCSSGLLSSNIF